MLTLKQSTDLCSLLADASRQRLLLLLETHPLSAAELTEITGLTQSRVSTHLSRLKAAGLVQAEKGEGAAIYSARRLEAPAARLWAALRGQLDDAQAGADQERATQVLRARNRRPTWAETVAGRMERHYSPGRTWEATAHALIGVTQLGSVLDLASGDGVFAELIAPRCRQVTCVDVSETVLAAAKRRLASHRNIAFEQGDMHALPFDAGRFDTVFALHALAYSSDPELVLREAWRVLKPSGALVAAALAAHGHAETVKAYDHRNLGVKPEVLEGLLKRVGFSAVHCAITSRETRPPYFEVVTAVARR